MLLNLLSFQIEQVKNINSSRRVLPINELQKNLVFRDSDFEIWLIDCGSIPFT